MRGLPSDFQDLADALPTDPAHSGGDHRGLDESFRRREYQPVDVLDRHVLIGVIDGYEATRGLGKFPGVVGED